MSSLLPSTVKQYHSFPNTFSDFSHTEVIWYHHVCFLFDMTEVSAFIEALQTSRPAFVYFFSVFYTWYSFVAVLTPISVVLQFTDTAGTQNCVDFFHADSCPDTKTWSVICCWNSTTQAWPVCFMYSATSDKPFVSKGLCHSVLLVTCNISNLGIKCVTMYKSVSASETHLS